MIPKRVRMIRDNSVATKALTDYAYTMLDMIDPPQEEVELLVKKTLDKFRNECYTLSKKEG